MKGYTPLANLPDEPYFRGIRAGLHGPTHVRVAGHMLDFRHDLFNHSPDGFEWGYCGSGPAQLAMAMLAEASGDDDLAVRMHQEFKRQVVAAFPHAEWVMTVAAVRAWIVDNAFPIAAREAGEE